MVNFRAFIWIFPFLYGLLLFLAGTVWLAIGKPFDPATYECIARVPWHELEVSHSSLPRVFSSLIRLLGGNSSILAGIFIMTVSVTGFRHAYPWAWWVSWALPIHAALDLIIVATYGELRTTVIV